MRVTDGNLFRSVTYRVNRAKEQLDKLTEQISSGKTANRLGDDPLVVQSIIRNDEATQRTEQFSVNNINVRNQLQVYESTVAETYEIISQMKSEVISIANESTSYEQRQAMIEKLDLYKEQLIALANTSHNDSYIYSGYKTDSHAYDENGVYQGDNGAIEAEVMEGVTIKTNMDGGQVFGGGSNPNTTDLFQLVEDLKTSMNGNFPEDATDLFDEIDQVADQVIRARSEIGARLVYCDIADNSLQRLEISNIEMRQQIEEVDYAEALVQYKSQELALNATLQTNSTLMLPSLLDYVR